MTKAIHLINRRDGVHLHGMTRWSGDRHGYRSCCWHISDDDAASLIDGWVYFHETKAKSAGFGGVILGFEAGEAALADRKAILFRADGAARDQKWRGAHHGMAMSSGVVEAQLPHESD